MSDKKPWESYQDQGATAESDQKPWETFGGETKPEGKGVAGHIRDLGVSALNSAIAVPEVAVGLGDIITGGRTGQAAERLGFRPGEAKEIAGDWRTDQYKQQMQDFQEADGVLDKVGVAVTNPSLIANTVVESLGSMGAGGVVARGLGAARGGLGRAIGAGAAGEGAAMAGAQAEEIRQQTDDGLLTPEQAGYSLATGGLGSLFGFAGGRLAKKLGIGDVDTMLARGVTPDRVAADLAAAPAKSIPRQVIEGAIAEGFLEELPQSVSETILQNLALDRHWSEGIEDAAVMGTLASMAMGGAGAGYSGLTRLSPSDQQAPPGIDPPISDDPAPDAPQAGPGMTPSPVPEQYRRETFGAGPVQPAVDTPAPIAEPVRAPTPSEQMGIDPSIGPLSTAAAIAVDSGTSQQIAQQTALAEAAEIAQQQQKGSKNKAPEQPSLALGEQVDPATGEIVGAPTTDRATELQERIGYIQQQARVNGWDKNLVDARTAAEAELARLQPQAKAKDAARQVIATGGTEADAMRAATDSLIGDMENTPGISIAQDAPAAVAAAKQEPKAPTTMQEGIEQVRAEKAETPAVPADIKAVIAKQIPQMTDAELQQAVAHYGPGHKRTAKLNKELAKRGVQPPQQPTEIVDGEQAPQAQQAGTQRAQTPGAAAQAQPATADPAAEGVTAASQWDAMSASERETALLDAGKWTTKKGALNVIGKRIAKGTLGQMPEADRAAIEQTLAARQPQSEAAAQNTVEQTGAKRFEVVGVRPAGASDDAGARVATTRPAPADGGANEEMARSGEHAAMQGFSMHPPSIIRKKAEQEAWESGWQRGKRKRDIALEGLEDVTVGDRVARPTLNSKNSVVWRDEKSGKDYDTAAKAKAGMKQSEAALLDLDDVKPSSDRAKKKAKTYEGFYTKVRNWDSHQWEYRASKYEVDRDTGKQVGSASKKSFKSEKEALEFLSDVPESSLKAFTDGAVIDGHKDTSRNYEKDGAHIVRQDDDGSIHFKSNRNDTREPIVFASKDKFEEYAKKNFVDWFDVRDKVLSALSDKENIGGLSWSELTEKANALGVFKVGMTRSEVELAVKQEQSVTAADSLMTEPNLESARKLLQEQKDATGNKKAEANVKRKIRALAKKTPITDERTVLALDMAATRLDMEGLGFAEAAPSEQGIAPEAETAAKDRPRYGESNKLVSQARREEIRALMRKKALNLNSGVDPELMALGAELAVFHIEAGTRKFADFAKAMIEDIGEKFTPFLRSFYDAARSYPGLDTEGMTPYEETIKQHAAMLTPAVREAAAEVVGTVAEKPKARTRKTGARGDMALTQDWGVEHIDGYGDSDRETGNDTKDAFLKETRNYLNAVADALRSHGYEPHLDRKGKPEKPVSVNEGGPAVSGDIILTMHNPDNGNSVYIHIGDTLLRGVIPSTQSGIAVMYRVGQGADRYAAKAGNTWAPVDLSANELAALMSNHAQSAVQQEGATNERTEIRGDGPQALADVAAAEGGQPESDRGSGASAADSGQERAAGSSGSDAAGVPAARSGRGGTGSVRNAPARARRQRGAVGEGRGSEAAEAVPQDDARVEVNGEPTIAPNIPAANFQITEETQLGKGGEVQKFNDNLAAIRALKQIEADHRRATPEEQAILARYVGWGGLANAFPDPTTGNFKDRWKDRGEQLRSLLTDDEYKAARRSTRNAHYTSETIVTAMWKAVEKMGFKGGLVLESSMGTGNFVGLAPQNTGAKFVGIEYDSLTARMAQALYPQATVLHSGFQRVPLTDNSFALNIGNPPFGSESLRFQYKPELQGVSIHNQFFRAGMDALRPGGIQSMVVSRFLMDAQDKSTRLALAKQARLVGLIRLPDTAFRENARTEVVTDIVILQKLSPEEQANMAEAVEAYQRGREKDAGKERERQALAARVPAWVETAQIPDPLGGEAMTVNAHFRDNPQDILGTLERSGSMQHGADITVRLDNTADLQGLLDSAIERLPSNIQNLDAEVMAATEDRFKSMSDALRIAVANEEVGHVGIDRDGKLQRVIERETPEGEYEYARQELTADSPWSDQLSMDADGKWYRLVVKTDDDGKPVKVVKDGKTTRLNVYERTTFDNEADIPSSLRLGKTGFERLTGMVGLRDLLKRQLTLETADAAKGVMEANRKALAKAYGEFTKKHGPINRPVNLRLAMTMPDGGLVAALEVGYQPARTAKQAEATGLDVQEEIATPAPIMRERVVPKYEPATRAESPSDALAISLAESGRVNMERIASLLDTTQEEAASQLQAGDSPLVFRDPETQQWETSDVYLTGMVKRKLQAAKAAGASQNVAALEKVIPEDWTAENVAVQMGSTWVPPGIYADFLNHLSGGAASVNFSPVTNSYSVSVKSKGETAAQWGTEDVSVDHIVGRMLNSQAVVVTRTDSEGKTYVDREATTLAGLKAREITAEFGDWVFKDGDRRNQLVELFNEKFNTRVGRQYNGQHMILHGKVPDSIIKMRRHQTNGAWRGVYEPFVLYDHAVGAGKTFTAIARAMERRRMGLSRKPMIVVPNHLVEQWETDVYRLYPGAKVLAAGKKDFEAKRRRRLFGKIATGDWDIVIVPHSSFGFIGISPETESRYLEQELREAHAAIEAAWEQAEEDGVSSGRRKPFGVKEAERLAEKLQARADAVSAGVRDRLLTFEQLGVDDLTVDEAHEFKNLNYSSRLTGVRGMGDKSGSRKATDLYNKIRVLRDNPNGSVAFLTGTPISNSAVEMFTMLRYLAADQLEEMGMTHFDAFRAQFVEATPAFEPTESGRLKEVTRLGRTWSNMRSLMDLYYTVTDAVSLDDIKRMYAEDNKGEPFPVPKIKGGKDRELIAIKPTPAQEQALTDVMAGFDGLDGIEDHYERNAERLRLMDRARKVSLDIRAVNPRSDSTEPNGKLEQVSNNVKRIYDQWSDDKGTQLIFLDRSVPKAKGDDKVLKEYDDLVAKRDEAMARGDQDAFEDAVEALDKYDSNEINELRIAQSSPWNAYQQIKDNLIAMGIPANEIRFVQEANNDEQKAALFDAVKSGMVRVLLGSTPRMGAGTNVQDLAVALHHVDVTWKPSDIEQREGRVIRQGNKLLEKYGPDFEVEILAYATERTVDAKMWDLNATKLRTINGIRKYDGAFSMEFEDEEAVGMAEMAALASGNPLLLERVQLESEIGNLELQERAHRRKMYGVQDELNAARRHIERNPGLIEAARSRSDAAKQRVDAVEQAQASRTVTVEGQQYSELSEALAAASSAVSLQQAGNESARYAITINGERVTSKDGISTAISGALGDSAAFEATVDGERVIQRTAAARRAADMLNTGEGTRTVEVGELFGYQLMADVDVSEVGETTYTNLSLALMDGGETIASADANEQQGQAKFVTANLRSPIDRLVETVKGIASGESAGLLERQLERAKRNLPSLEERAGETFPKAEDLANKRARLTEVVVELDAAAPQAPSAEVETGDAPAFSFAGRRAMTSDPVALRAAQLRLASGENAETVRQETGWHRGNDGKWRFEISDDQASLKYPGTTFGEVFADAYAEAFAEGRRNVTVGDLLSHPQLFAAYPALTDTPVSEMPAGERALARLQRRATGMAIQVQAGMPSNRVVSVLLHELQHGIQTIEGFARGGSANRMVSGLDRTGAEAYRRLAGEVEARNTQAHQSMTERNRQRISPDITADVPASDVIVTFNGTEMVNGPLPGNAATRPAMTQGQVVRAFHVQFPKLVPAIRTMLNRGAEGKRGGLVLVDSADPLMIARAFSKKTRRPLTETVQMFSEAGTINGFYDPQSGLTFLVTPNLDAVTAPAVLLHEMVHGQQRQRIDRRAVEMLMNRGSVRNPDMRAFLDRVADRMIDSGEGSNESEAAAYIVEQAVIEGRSQGYAMADSRFLGWVDKAFGQRVGDLIRSFLGNVRSWMLRNGMKPGEITVDDLVGYAMAGVERAADGRVDGAAGFSQDAITNTPAFKRWFGDSKVVDAEGKPLVVYHGSPDVRGIIEGGFAQSPVRGSVFFFTDSVAVADTYADDRRAFDYQNAEPHVLPVYLSMQNPYVVDAKGARWRETERHIKEARDGGHDGIIIRNSRDEYNNLRDGGQLSTVYAVFEPTQVKSAATGNLRSRVDGIDLGDISNRGTYDPDNPHFLFSRSSGDSAGRRGRKPLPEAQLRRTVEAFFRHYRGADNVGIEYHATAQTLPGYRAGRDEGAVIGGQYEWQTDTVHLVVSAFDSQSKVREALQEEVLVHKGLGFFRPEDRQQLYRDIQQAAQESPEVAALWDRTVLEYQDVAESAKLSDEQANRLYAEELLGTLAQRRINWLQRGWRTLRKGIKRLLVKAGWVNDRIGLDELRGRIDLIARAFERGQRTPRRNFSRDVRGVASGSMADSAGNVGAYGQRPVTADEAARLGMTQDEANDAQGSGDILFSRSGGATRSGIKQFAAKATDELNKTFNAPGKLSLWHKTVGTMYNLAERSPAFKPVFEAAQGFIDDVANYAADAAEMAPQLLPKLETWRDMLKRPITAEDNEAIAKPIFEGTLVWARDLTGKAVRVEDMEAAAAGMTTDQKADILLENGRIPEGMLRAWKAMSADQYAKMINSRYESQMLKPGVVWSDAELRSIFNLNDGQIELYREFRAATDRSLDTMARADLLRFGGEDAKALRDEVMDAADVRAAAILLRDHFAMLADQNPSRATQLLQTAHGMMERADRVAELQAEGYAPLSRFGKYTVDVVEDGERQYFGLFETQREANLMAEQMRAEFGQGSVTQGTLSDESFKLFAGITPESLELFGNMLGLDSTGDSAQDQAFQQYLRLTKTNRSAMRRLIHRKGIAGFSEDVGRVLASFVYSNARQTAAGLNMGDLGEAVNAIPKEQGELKDAAVRLGEYIKNPQEEAQAMRGLLFAQYLGGSVASAFVNLTQPVQVTFPWLSQYAGARNSAKELTRAVKQMSTRGYKYEADLAAALKAAEDDGTVSPQEVHQLMAQARGSGSLRTGDGTRVGDARATASNSVTRLSMAWGKMFGAAEQANRRITFIAAYRVARDKGMPNPEAFARRAVQETQFVYSKAAKMQWGRGAIGGTLMTFKTYSVSYIELMHRLWTQGEPGSEERAEGRKAAMIMVATLMLMGGVGGLPFMEDIEDVIDGAAQLMGYNLSSKKAKEDFLREVFGDALGEFIEKGVSGLPGAPMDVSGRLGMGNLIPGTGLFQERTSHTRDVLEIMGPAGDFANRILAGGRQILGGDIGAGLLEVSPVAVRNAAKGIDMAVHDMYRDTKGYKVLDTNILEAALKAGGFQPASVAKVQEANWLNQRAKNFYNMQAQEIRATWAAGIFEKNPAKVQRARDAVAEWNRKNPNQPMIIRIPDVMRRVREMSKTKDERIAATAPRAMRAQMREDLARVREGL